MAPLATTSEENEMLTDRLATWRRWTDIPLIAIALGSLPILVLELVRDRLSDADRMFISITNVIVFAAFLLDYVIELCLTRNRRNYIRTEWSSLLIAASQGLALLPSLGFLGATRVFRAARPILFTWRLLALGLAEAKELKTALKRHAIATAASVAGLVWIGSAVAFTIVEDVGYGRRIASFGDALWWSASTISTVGYGDVYPVTSIGRVIAVLTMIVGVSTFGVVTAKLASVLIRS